MSTPVWVTLVPASLSAFAALSSATTALIVARIQHQKNATDAFFKIMDRFESAELRKSRYVIYALDRMAYTKWTIAEKEAVGTWCAHIDLVANLTISRRISSKQIFELYGDVMVRSVYILSPYILSELPNRGMQYLIALRKFSHQLPRLWRRQIISGSYARVILIPGNAGISITPDLLASDAALTGVRWRRRSRSWF